MNQRQLHYFLEVYKRKSITEAAKALYISPQGLSKTILSLEEELGVTLFTRKHNRIKATKEAAMLAVHAKNIIEEYSIITDKLFNEERVLKTLSIYCSYDVPQLISADFFHEFYKEYPEIKINMKEYPDIEIHKAIEKGDIELGIIPGPFDAKKFQADSLCTEPFCLVVNKEHPLAKFDEISIKELGDEPIAIKDATAPTSMNQMQDCLKEGFAPNIILESSDTHLIHQMAENNYAIGMSLSYLAKKNRSNKIKIVRFKEECLAKNIFLVTNKNNFLSFEAEAFRHTLLEYFANKKSL